MRSEKKLSSFAGSGGARKFNNGWCFAIVNGRLAEIYFRKKYGVYAHCYVKREDYGRGERKIIDDDIRKYRFIYQKGYYTDILIGVKSKVAKIEEIFPAIKNRNLVKFLTT